MIFVIGGAYQGKRSFATEALCKDNKTKCLDCSSFHEFGQKTGQEISKEEISLEKIVGPWIQEGDYSTILVDQVESLVRHTKFKEIERVVDELIILNQRSIDAGVELVLIGTQMGSGVVPIDPNQRVFRDNVGFLFQQIARQSREVYRVWAGLPEKIK